MPWLRWLVACLMTWRPGFNRRPVHMEFVIDRVALGQVLLSALFSDVCIIPSIVDINSSVIDIIQLQKLLMILSNTYIKDGKEDI
jgi:hypothetical protein